MADPTKLVQGQGDVENFRFRLVEMAPKSIKTVNRFGKVMWGEEKNRKML